MIDHLWVWLAMGGYAAYVWPAYAIALAVLAGFSLRARQRYRRAQQALTRVQALRPERV